jgi:hypothetical protein
MIDGLLVDLNADEVKKLFQNAVHAYRIRSKALTRELHRHQNDYHGQQPKPHARQGRDTMGAMPFGMALGQTLIAPETETEVPDSECPESMWIKRRIEELDQKAQFLNFCADHVVRDEVYRLALEEIEPLIQAAKSTNDQEDPRG